MLTGLTAEADVGTEPHHSPLEPAAGMRLAQADDVIDPKLDDHAISQIEPRAGRHAARWPPAERRKRSQDPTKRTGWNAMS